MITGKQIAQKPLRSSLGTSLQGDGTFSGKFYLQHFFKSGSSFHTVTISMIIGRRALMLASNRLRPKTGFGQSAGYRPMNAIQREYIYIALNVRTNYDWQTADTTNYPWVREVWEIVHYSPGKQGWHPRAYARRHIDLRFGKCTSQSSQMFRLMKVSAGSHFASLNDLPYAGSFSIWIPSYWTTIFPRNLALQKRWRQKWRVLTKSRATLST